MRLKIPLQLAVVLLTGGLAGCPGSGNPPNQSSNLCPADYYCTSDAARAFNCTDAAPVDPANPVNPLVTDLGSCFAPI